MALATRGQFVQQTASSGVALYGLPIELLAGARRIFEAPEQHAARLDAAAIRRLASEITGHVITTEAPDYESSHLIFNRAFDQRPALIVRFRRAASSRFCPEPESAGGGAWRRTRLVEIKKKYDPENVLRLNQNIQPDRPSNN
jgi:hypothetical protein